MFKSEEGSRDVFVGGLTMDKGFDGHVGRKSLISLAQIQFVKEIRREK
jgi:hypothetical protein